MTTETKNRKTLADIASDAGVFAIIAMDQRNTLRRMFKPLTSTPMKTTCAPPRLISHAR